MDSIFNCNICNKNYSSKNSLYNHNNKYHNIKIINKNSKSLTCDICNKIFNTRPAKSMHKKKCKTINNITKITELELEKIKLDLANKELQILQLKLKLEKSNKIDNITLKKLNKILIERNTKIKHIQNTTNINTIINNYQLVGFGKEEINDTLTKHDKKIIMNAKYGCLEKLVEIVHCGKYNKFKNIIITNIKDNYMYKYDDKKGYFILSTKNEVLNSLIDYRIYDLEVIYNDLSSNNKLDDKTKDIIENFINKINYCDVKFTDCDGILHDNYKIYKINEIKILLFNNQDKINSDISLFLMTNEIN